MMAESSPELPKPTLEVSHAVTDTDHGKIVTVPALLCLIASALFLAARLQIRWPWKSLFGQDDWVSLAATAVTFAQTALVLYGIDGGFGRVSRELEQAQIESIERIMYTSDLLYVLSLCLGKLAIAFLFRRFASAQSRIKSTWVFAGAIVIFGIAGFLMIALRSDISQPWVYDQTTGDSTYTRWLVIGIFGILVDVVSLVFPIYLIWGVHMDRSSKSVIIAAFALRFPTVPLTIVRLHSIRTFDANDYNFNFVLPEVYTQLEMHYNLISATIPCLRIFLKAWNTSSLDLRLQEFDRNAYMEHATSHGDSYGMTSMKNSKASQSGRQGQSQRTPWSHREDYGITEARVNGGGHRDDDTNSESSQKAIVVKQTVDVNVA